MVPHIDNDFIGFTYNGFHSINSLGIYRVSNSNRYEEPLIPTIKDITSSVPGQIGQYYLGTKIETKTFTINFAFDNLTETKFRLV